MLSDLGLHVTVVHASKTLMNVQLDELGGEMLERQIERCGIFVRTRAPSRRSSGPNPSKACGSTTARRSRPTCWCSPAASARASTSRLPRDSRQPRDHRQRRAGHGGARRLRDRRVRRARRNDVRHRRARLGAGQRPRRRLERSQSAGALPRLEALHAAQGGGGRRRVDGHHTARARQRRGHPGDRERNKVTAS